MGILDDLKMEYRTGGITQRLIFWNVGLFVVPMVVFSILSLFGTEVPFLRWDDYRIANDWLSISSDPAALLWKPWSLITYAFLHAGFLHLFFNMLMLFFAGRVFLTFFTQKQLFGLYLLSAIFAGIIFIISYNFLPALSGYTTKMVGASAAIMAILIATATYAPYYQVRLMLIGTVKLWHIALVLVVLDLIYVSAENTGGHLAHLAGALSGFIYIKLLQSGTDLSKGVSAVLDFFAGLFRTRREAPFKKVHRNTTPPPKRSPGKPKDITQNQIDDELKKSGGYIPGIRPGKNTAEYIDNVMSRITLPGSLFLALIAILPAFANLANINTSFAYFYGGTSLLIMVGVVLDTLAQIDSHLKMREMDGLMKSGRIKGRNATTSPVSSI